MAEILKQVEAHLSTHEVTVARDLASRMSRVRSPGTFFIQLLRSKLFASCVGLDLNALLLSLRPPSRHVKRRRRGKALQKYVTERHVATAMSSFQETFHSCLSDDELSTPPESDESSPASSSEEGGEGALSWMRRSSGASVDEEETVGRSKIASPLSNSALESVSRE